MNGKHLLKHMAKWRLLYVVTILASLSFVGVNAFNSYSPTVISDKDDYAPGEIAIIKGFGWIQDSLVDIHLEEDPSHDHHHAYHDTKVNPDGTWQIEYPIEDRHLGVKFTVIVEGKQSSTKAYTYFTDANNTSLTVTSPASGNYGGTVTLSATLKQQGGGNSGVGHGNPIPGVPIAFSLNGISVGSANTNAQGLATLTVNVPGAINAGTYNSGIAATFAGNSQYNSKDGSGQLIINKIPTSLSVSSVIGIYGGNVTLQANLKSGGSNFSNRLISFKLNGTTVGTATTNNGGNASLSTNLGTIAEGTYPNGITADYAGETNYAASSDVASLTVNSACTAPSVSTQPSASVVTYGDNSSFTIVVAGTAPQYQWQVNSGTGFTDISGANTATLSLANPSVSLSGNQYRCVVTNACGTATSNAATLTVQKAAATVTLANLEHTYNGTAKAATASTNATGTSTFTFTYNGSAEHPINHKTGGYAVVATLVNENYSGSATGTLTISKANQIITWATPESIVYGTGLSASELNASLTTGDGTLSYVPALGTVLNAGNNQSLTVTAAGTNNYNEAQASVTINVAQATPSVLLSVGGPYTYDGNSKLAVATVAGVGGTDLGVATLSYKKGEAVVAAPVNAGSYEVLASFAGNTNYNAATASGTLVINKATASFVTSNLSHIYDGTVKSITVATSPEGLTGVLLTNNGKIDVSDYTVGISLNNENYAAADISETLSITPRAITVTADAGQSKVYGDVEPVLTYKVTSGSLVDVSHLTGMLTRETGNNVNIYAILKGTLAATSNYTLQFASGATFSITPKPVTASILASDKVYDGTTVASAAGSVLGVIGSDEIGLTVSGAAFSDKNVATGKTVSANVAISNPNYSLSSPTASTMASITPAALTASITALDKVYDGSTAAIVNAGLEGVIGGDQVTVSASNGAFADKNAGTGKAVTAGISISGTDSDNYAVNATAATTASITARPIAVAAVAKDKVYGDNDPALTYTLTSGELVVGDSFSGALKRVAGENVGNYAIQQEDFTAGGNYAITFTGANFEITKAPLTVTAHNSNRLCGQVNNTFTGTITGTKRSDAITATYTSVADASSAAGTYAIVPAPAGANLGNYEVTLVNGVLTIGNVIVDAAANSTPQAVKNTATTVTIQVTNSAGGVAAGVPVKLYFDTQSVVEVNTNESGVASFTVGVLQPGVYKIRAVAGAGCSESTVYLPVYDPNGGFVTGGGWIDSPAGAYKADMELTGKAHFGFVAKYKKGSTIPDGNTEFQFQAGNLNFNSSAYDDMRLVIAGAKANYKGTGKINGAGNYGFMVSAIDGQATGGDGIDKFRIRIWDKNNGDAVVYDNNILNTEENADPATALGGGSIVIHDGSNKSVSTAPVVKKVMAEGIDALSTARFDNYPNAFSDRTTIRFSLDTEQNFALEVYDIRGALVKKVGTGIAEAGKVYEYELDARNLAEGVYFARLASGSRIQTIKMLLKK